jgi:hypothetical protein
VEIERPVGGAEGIADEDLDADAARFVVIERVSA